MHFWAHFVHYVSKFNYEDVVWDIFVFALGNTPGFHLIRAKVCSVFKLKFALNIPYYVYLFLETRHTISRCHIATHFDLKACPSTCLNLFVVTKCLKHTLGYHDTDITIYMHQQHRRQTWQRKFLFDFMLNVPIKSKGHVGTLPPFYGTFTQSEDVMTSNKCFKYNHPTKPQRLIMDGLI